MGLKIATMKVIEVKDFNDLVVETYGKPYNYQQQNGCKPRGIERITVPWEDGLQDFENDSIPEKVNGPEYGVSFKAWLARDPEQSLSDEERNSNWMIDLFWHRNFYPHIGVLVDDLYEKGLLPEGEYSINIDW